jgi:hypothetical protein
LTAGTERRQGSSNSLVTLGSSTCALAAPASAASASAPSVTAGAAIAGVAARDRRGTRLRSRAWRTAVALSTSA